MSERPSEAAGVPRARMMLQRAHWAATAFAGYDLERTRRIVDAVADAAYQNAKRYAEWAVSETGMGVAEHKLLKNEACSRGLVEWWGGEDYVSARVLADQRIVEIPRPAGVVLALTPSTNPVATLYFKVLLSLMTRNAVVVSPHPLAREVCTDAARLLAQAAVAAGAPDGCVQVVEEPTIPLIEALMSDPTTDVIVATGGTAVVRAAYRSGNPAWGVGPGNVPALVDHTADLDRAAERLMDSKSFDNSILCTNESCAIVEERIADAFQAELARHGGHVLSAEEAAAVREKIYPDGKMRTDLAGKDAAALAVAAGIRVPPRTRVLVAPFPLVVPEDPLAREKLFPLLGLVRVPDARRGIDTNLAPTMTIGTGFFGRSSIGENIGPKHLVNWTRIAYSDEAGEAFGDFSNLETWNNQPALPVGREAPMTIGRLQEGAERADESLFAQAGSNAMTDEIAAMREEIRRIVLEELRSAFRK